MADTLKLLRFPTSVQTTTPRKTLALQTRDSLFVIIIKRHEAGAPVRVPPRVFSSCFDAQSGDELLALDLVRNDALAEILYGLILQVF